MSYLDFTGLYLENAAWIFVESNLYKRIWLDFVRNCILFHFLHVSCVYLLVDYLLCIIYLDSLTLPYYLIPFFFHFVIWYTFNFSCFFFSVYWIRWVRIHISYFSEKHWFIHLDFLDRLIQDLKDIFPKVHPRWILNNGWPNIIGRKKKKMDICST